MWLRKKSFVKQVKKSSFVSPGAPFAFEPNDEVSSFGFKPL